MEAKQARPHSELIAQLLDSRIPKTEREHAAAREIERLRADLLQELIDAPEPEPVGYTNETELDYVRKYEALPVSGVFWPTSGEDACVALYTAPPAKNQSEYHLEMVNAPAPSVPDGWKNAAEWLRNNYQDYPNISSLCEAMVAQSANNGSN